MFPENFVPASAVMVRRDEALEVGGYDEGLNMVEDLDLLVRLLERGTGLAVPTLGTFYHFHAGQMSGDRSGMRQVHAEVIAKYADRPWWDDELAHSYDGLREWDEGRAALRSGDRAAALSHLTRILASPARARAVLEVIRWRARGRRMLRRSPAIVGASR
jgi:hypothetical protein